MDANQEGKAEQILKDFGKKLDQFYAEAKTAGSKVEGDLRKKYEELKATAETLKRESTNKERWKEVEASLKKAGEDLENAVKAAFRKPNQ